MTKFKCPVCGAKMRGQQGDVAICNGVPGAKHEWARMYSLQSVGGLYGQAPSALPSV